MKNSRRRQDESMDFDDLQNNSHMNDVDSSRVGLVSAANTLRGPSQRTEVNDRGD